MLEARPTRADVLPMLSFSFWLSLAGTLILLLASALALQVVPAMGIRGPKHAERLSRQPWVDILVGWFTVAPWAMTWLIAGGAGLAGSVGGQLLVLGVWCVLHTQAHSGKSKGVTLHKTLAGRLGAVRTYAALWFSLIALPLLISMRVMQIVIWPVFRRLMKLPREQQRVYFSFSRHKARGISGMDMVWGLYAEWAVGVWSLSGQIMRHAASLWCPMRFADDAKNTACVTDFPDIGRWGEPGSMESAARVIEQMHSGASAAWFGHPSRAAAADRPEQKAA